MKKVKSKEEWRIGNIQYPTSKPESEQSNHPITPVANGQRQVSGLRVGYGREGPPGRARSPGTGISPLRDHPPWQLLPEFIEGENIQYYNKFSNYKQMNINILINNKNKHFLTNNFLTIKFFKIMKKQILILAFLVLAIFASVNNSYGQLLPQLTAAPTFHPASTAVGAACAVQDALHPIAGTLYTYTATVSNGGTAPTIRWFVTDNPQFIVAPVSGNGGGTLTQAADIETTPTSTYLQATGTTYNVAANTTATVDITWKYFAPTPEVFLVAYVSGDPTCTDNIQVYRIIPVQVFTLDLAALTAAGAENTVKSDCVSPVRSATYVPASTNVVMDYGVNYVYFSVTAANFAHSWLPTFQVTATNMTATAPAVGDGTLAVDWAYPAESTGATPVWHATTAAGAIFTPANADHVAPRTALATGVGSAGEDIVVRVTVDHNKNQTLSDIVISFAVDGRMYNFATADYTNALLGDIHYQEGATLPAQACPWVDGYLNDATTYTLTRRPTIVDGTTPPAGDDFLPKN